MKWSALLLMGCLWLANGKAWASPQLQKSNESANQAQSNQEKPEPTSSTQPQTGVSSLETDLAMVQATVKSVKEPTGAALAKGLGAELVSLDDGLSESPAQALADLGDLDGDGVHEFIFKRMRPENDAAPGGGEDAEARLWQLFLFSWDGSAWRASSLTQGFEPIELRTLSSLFSGSNQIALVVYATSNVIPFPSIYRIKDHAASLAWDGRSDETDYQGYAHGEVQFRAAAGSDPPAMVVTGRADPGLLHFPVGGRRGFNVRASYAWDGKGFVEKKTEFSVNEDRTLYEFISALHLHNFRAAYALIDPARFLKTDAPSLDIFRKKVEGAWPEFLEDHIFEVPENPADNSPSFQFELDLEDKQYVYMPSFTAGPKILLTGLDRREVPRADQ